MFKPNKITTISKFPLAVTILQEQYFAAVSFCGTICNYLHPE